MAGAFNNIHPGLSHAEALRLLTVPLDQLDSGSDVYMAASHLINFPGEESEAALLTLVADERSDQPVRLARRKAVEVLARLKCQQAIAPIGACLDSDDVYLIENAAWALQQLDCQSPSLHQRLIELLADERQNRRVVVQALAGLQVKAALEPVQALTSDLTPGVRGAALAAVAQLSDRLDGLEPLADHLLLANQMDRQAAIQDIIDAGDVRLLPAVLTAPVSPVFRMRALRHFWDAAAGLPDFDRLAALDQLLMDAPHGLQLVHQYDNPPADEFLVQEFFGTDFSRCYLALKTLEQRDPVTLWPLLRQRWDEEAHNDYGAHYFFVRLFGMLSNWPEAAHAPIVDLLEEAARNQRPQFMKSKPAAILSLEQLAPERLLACLPEWLNPESMPFWECRYVALLAIERLISQDQQQWRQHLLLLLEDPDARVALRAQQVLAVQG